jgi:O-antigen ligase
MLDNPSLSSLPFALRLIVLVACAFLTYRYTKRGFHNGILFGLITGATSITLFKHSEILPGLPIISLERIVWPTVLIVFLMRRLRGETKRLPLDWIERSLLAFIAIMLVSMVSHGTHLAADGEWSLFKIMRGYIIPLTAYFTVRRAAATYKNLREFIIGLGVFALYLAATGMAEVFHITPLIFPQFIINPDVGIHFGQVRGIFVNGSMFGLALATALPFVTWLFFTDRPPRRYLWAFAAALSAIPLIYTFQRAAWLSAMVAIGVTAVAWPTRRVILTWTLMFMAVSAFWLGSDALMDRLGARVGNTATIDYRLAHIERGWAMFRDHPIVGVGINRYVSEVENYSSFGLKEAGHAHNTWLTLLVELGLVGFLFFLAPFALVLSKSLFFYLRFPRARTFLGILAGITLAFLVMSLSIDMRVDMYSNTLLFTLWALILGTMRRPSRIAQHRKFANRNLVNSQAISVSGQEQFMPASRAPRWP